MCVPPGFDRRTAPIEGSDGPERALSQRPGMISRAGDIHLSTVPKVPGAWARRVGDGMNPASCLPDDTLLALADGALAGETLDAVQTHLDSCPTCRRLLVALSGSADEASGDPAEALELPVGKGTRIGRYVVESVLGA